MGSRVRENPKMLFDLYCEVHKLEGSNPNITRKYPENYDGNDLKQIPKFAFPCEMEEQHIQHFSFVLTSMDSKYTFGYCRYDPTITTTFVVLSPMPWHDIFYRFLNCVAHLSRNEDKSEMIAFLTACHVRPPFPGHTLKVTYNDGKDAFQCECPGNVLPSIPENCNLTHFFSALDSKCMAGLFAALLHERRVAIVATKPSRLSAIVQAANALLYPMSWQHIFIPVLPLHLVDYLLAPMPFLIGVPRSVMSKIRMSDVGEIVLVDADTNELTSPFNDLDTIPSEVVSNLRKALNDKNALGDAVSRAFLRALVHLIGGYKSAIRIEKRQNITFNAEEFVKTRKNMELFLTKILQSQIFQQFIEERLEILNSGRGFKDLFEDECYEFDMRTSEGREMKLRQQYKEWAKAMKREGGAILKSVKEKANPAMKSAVNSFRQGGRNVKSAVKGLKNKIPKSPAGRLSTADDTKSTSSSAESVSSHNSVRSAPVSPTARRVHRPTENNSQTHWSGRLPLHQEISTKPESNGDASVVKEFEDLINFTKPLSRVSSTLPPRLPERPQLPPRYPIVPTRNLIDLTEAPPTPPRTGHVCGRSQFYSEITKSDKPLLVSRVGPVHFKQVNADGRNGGDSKMSLWKAVSAPRGNSLKASLSAPPSVPSRPKHEPPAPPRPPRAEQRPSASTLETPIISANLMDIDPMTPGLKSVLDSFDPLRSSEPNVTNESQSPSIWSPVQSLDQINTLDRGDAWSNQSRNSDANVQWKPRLESRNTHADSSSLSHRSVECGDTFWPNNNLPRNSSLFRGPDHLSQGSPLSQLSKKGEFVSPQVWVPYLTVAPSADVSKASSQKSEGDMMQPRSSSLGHRASGAPMMPLANSVTDKELLREYGIDFEKFKIMKPLEDEEEEARRQCRHNETF